MKKHWIKFAITAALYALFVVWTGSYGWLLGIIVIFDIYVSKKVRWAFWKPKKTDKGAKKKTLEWVDALIFAVVAATLIRVFFVEAYTIPTSSMEKTLMVGDYLFVSKIGYGPKLPNTPLSVPLVHNTLPFTQYTPSYVEWIKRPYRRLKGFGQVQRNDIVVFNFPEGDTVVAERQNESYYALVRQHGRDKIHQHYTILARPVDKCENYIKRCVAIAGDTLQIIDGQRFVNGVMRDSAPNMQKNYFIKTQGTAINPRVLDKIGIPRADRMYDSQFSVYELPLTKSQVADIQALSNIDTMVVRNNIQLNPRAPRVFPQTASYQWTEDTYGPIWIPRKGDSIVLDSLTLPLYRRVIAQYEHNQLEEREDGIYINGSKASSYTFKMNYYWMMGDNRHNSLDARFWGFVPEDHIVGRASMVWMSLDPDKKFPSNIRWRRLFRVMK
ncbi:signal peptidase I [Bacteroidia bacterium]|nr:signal peptidase I [Bacteroidia bacterium]